MTYDKFKTLFKIIEPGDLILLHSRDKSIVSGLIEKIDKCPYSHVLVVLSPTHILDIEFPFSNIKKLSSYITYKNYKDFDVAVVKVLFTNEEREIFINRSHKLSRKFYNFLQLFGFIISYIIGYLKKKIDGRSYRKEINNPFAVSSWMVCSSISRILKDINTNFDLSKYETSGDIDMVSPKDFYYAPKYSPYFIIKYETLH